MYIKKKENMAHWTAKKERMLQHIIDSETPRVGKKRAKEIGYAKMNEEYGLHRHSHKKGHEGGHGKGHGKGKGKGYGKGGHAHWKGEQIGTVYNPYLEKLEEQSAIGYREYEDTTRDIPLVHTNRRIYPMREQRTGSSYNSYMDGLQARLGSNMGYIDNTMVSLEASQHASQIQDFKRLHNEYLLPTR